MKKGKTIFAVIMAMALAFVVVGCGKKDDNDKKDGNSGASATAFEKMNTTTLDGEKTDSKIFAKNKVTVVNIWSLTCPPCIAELPHLSKINDKLKSKGVGVIGIVYETGKDDSNATLDKTKDLLKKVKATHPQLKLSEDMLKSEEFSNIAYFPTTFFVDSKGKVLKQKAGAADEKGWEDEILEVLKDV